MVDFSEVLEEIMARRQRKDIKSEINIVPFLDVLLVLVLIFMATAPIISQSVQVELPGYLRSSGCRAVFDFYWWSTPRRP